MTRNHNHLGHAPASPTIQLVQAEQMVIGDWQLAVAKIASRNFISIKSVCEDLKISSRWVSQMLVNEHKAASFAMCQVMLTHDVCGDFIPSIVTVDETWIPFFNPENQMTEDSMKALQFTTTKEICVTASTEKMMLAVFWDKALSSLIAFSGVHHSDSYIPRVLFHQDNAAAHWASHVQRFLGNNILQWFLMLPTKVALHLVTLDVSNAIHSLWSHIFQFHSCISGFPVSKTDP